MNTETGAAVTLRSCIDEALDLLNEERRIFLSGTYEHIARITQAKLAVLEKLEDAIRSTPRSPDLLVMLRNLIEMSRRNEQIIEAARQGFLFARRKISRIREATNGAVAYAEDGSRIKSAADIIGKERHA